MNIGDRVQVVGSASDDWLEVGNSKIGDIGTVVVTRPTPYVDIRLGPGDYKMLATRHVGSLVKVKQCPRCEHEVAENRFSDYLCEDCR